MPRMIRSTRTPARLAAYSASIERRVDERVELDDDVAVGAEARLVLDEIGELVAHLARRDEQVPVVVRPAVAGEVVEQLRHVRADVGIARDEADVLVDARGAGVVVARADVAVATQAVVVVAHDQHALRVRLQPDEAVHDVDAGALERLRPR